MNDESYKVNPDTFGCEAIFTRYFVNDDMWDDFPIIANALKHHVYYRFVNLVRKKKIPFGYISTSNIDKGLKQMAEEL